MTHKFIFR